MAWPALLGLAGVVAWIATAITTVAQTCLAYLTAKSLVRFTLMAAIVALFAGSLVLFQSLIDTAVSAIPASPATLTTIATWFPSGINTQIAAIVSALGVAITYRLGMWLLKKQTEGIF